MNLQTGNEISFLKFYLSDFFLQKHGQKSVSRLPGQWVFQ